jgi:integrase/recombinase XerD
MSRISRRWVCDFGRGPVLCQSMGDVSFQDVSASTAANFFAGAGPVTRVWQLKHSLLRGAYKFAIARGDAKNSAVPNRVPKPSQTFVPDIYSREELRRLLDAIPSVDHHRNVIDPENYRVILLLLYGTELRTSEALALSRADIDLAAGTLLIRWQEQPALLEFLRASVGGLLCSIRNRRSGAPGHLAASSAT